MKSARINVPVGKPGPRSIGPNMPIRLACGIVVPPILRGQAAVELGKEAGILTRTGRLAKRYR